jgi:nitrite reductase/ring-hydroxylating ferredoxin subunit
MCPAPDCRSRRGGTVAHVTQSETASAEELAPGTVRRIGRWTVGNAKGSEFAVSRRCRHQFADLSGGWIDDEGCLVCPWHQSRYDVTDGAMVSGPRGFLGWHGPTPGYTQFVRGYARRWRLRVRRVVRRDGRLAVAGD